MFLKKYLYEGCADIGGVFLTKVLIFVRSHKGIIKK